MIICRQANALGIHYKSPYINNYLEFLSNNFSCLNNRQAKCLTTKITKTTNILYNIIYTSQKTPNAKIRMQCIRASAKNATAFQILAGDYNEQ
jgi:hypothetical protein